jgi:hypothetical protein
MKNTIQTYFPGIACSVNRQCCLFFGSIEPVVGGAVFSITLAFHASIWKRPAAFDTGIRFTSNTSCSLL